MDWAAARPRLAGPAFAPVAPFVERLDPARWPTLEALNALAAGIATGRGRPLRFVPPRAPGERSLPPYELRVARDGEVETRPENWHDLFNALAWLAWPRTKAALNARHATLLEAGGEAEARRRGPARDALTLFDEGGVAVATCDPAVPGLVRAHEWKALFWHRREALAARVHYLAFGHSLLEKALDPFAGIVAKTVFLEVDGGFASLAPAAQVARADALLAAHFADPGRFPTPRAMAPLPAMGIPGWHPGTARESWYDDAEHFRPRPARRGECP